MPNQDLSFLLPFAPKLDKIAALYVLLTYVVKQPLETVGIFFYNVDLPVPPDAIDVDARSDYKSSGFRSATQRVLDDAPYAALNLRAIPGMDHFASRFDLNNANGSLKNRFPQNFFNFINDWPRVGHNVPRDQHMMEVIEIAFQVFDLYFAAAAVNQDAVEKIVNPFCFDGVRHLGPIAQQSTAEIIVDILYMDDRTGKADDLTRKRAQAIQPELTFEVPTKGDQMVGGAVYRTDDRRLLRYLFDLHPETHVFAVKHRTGNVVIMTRGQQDFSALAQALNELEPGLWHHETRYRSPFLANGGETRSVRSTALTASQIRDLLVKHFIYTTRSQSLPVT